MSVKRVTSPAMIVESPRAGGEDRAIGFVHELRTPRVVFAAGALERIGDETAALGGTRVLVVADAHAARARRRVEEALGGRLAAVVDEVVEHVPAEVAARAINVANRCEADVAVCIGGGSATGLGKAVAHERALPLLAVPTTYAGSEMTDIWGLTEGQRKRTGRDERVRPRTVVYDPELTLSMPSSLTATSGMNALAHCVEAAYAADASPIVRLLAVEGVRALAEALPRCVAQPSDLDARARALYGAWLAGMTLGNASMGIHHKLCHVLGGAYRLPHGDLHSALLPYSAAFNREHARGAMRRLGDALGADDAPSALWLLARRLGSPTSLSEIGFPVEAISAVADMTAAAPPANPRPVDPEGVHALLRQALTGTCPAIPVARKVS